MIGNHHFDIIDSLQHFGGESNTNPLNRKVSKTNNSIKDGFGLINWTHSDNQRTPIKLAHHVLWLCVKGNCQVLIGQHQFTFSTSSIGIISPNQVVKVFKTSHDFKSHMICFTEGFLKNCLIESKLFDQLLLVNPDYPPVYELLEKDYKSVSHRFQEIRHEYSEKRPFHLNLIRFLIVQLLYDYNRACEMCLLSFRKTMNRQYQIVYKFKKLVEFNFLNKKTISEYSNQLNLSPKHLSDCAKKETGFSAIEIIHNRILLESEYLLLHTSQSIKEITVHLGFDTSSHFSRFFKSKTGLTPSKFREIRKIGSSFRIP